MTTDEKSRGGQATETTPLASASLAGDKVPTRILLTPWGAVESSNGSFVVDEESVAAAVRAFEEHGTDLPIDYEHQTLGGRYAAPNGQAPAAGWIKRIAGEPGVGLVATIEWTESGAAMLAGRHYRYLSPVAIIRRTDRRLLAIHSAALTNKPAIRHMAPIVNRDHRADSTAGDLPLQALREELDLDHDTAAEEVLTAAGRRLAELRREAEEHRVTERIREAMRAGKLVDAQRAWAEALVAREEELFDEWLATAPIVVAPGRTAAPEAGGKFGGGEAAIAARARAQYRSHPPLASLTSEEAFVADAVRSAGATAA